MTCGRSRARNSSARRATACSTAGSSVIVMRGRLRARGDQVRWAPSAPASTVNGERGPHQGPRSLCNPGLRIAIGRDEGEHGVRREEARVPFQDRRDAGRQLGRRMAPLAGRDVVVLGLPRGGVPVAAEVARALGAPLDVVLVRKLGLPRRPELAMGAVGEDGVVVLNEDVLEAARVDEATLAEVERRERAELERRARQLRGDRPRLSLDGRTAVVVDDGVATGATARAACEVVRAHGAARVVLAVPVGSPHALADIAPTVDEVVCLDSPQRFAAVGQAYADFRATEEEEVLALLRRPAPAPAAAGTAPATAPSPRCCTARGWPRCWSTCSPRPRRPPAARSSTSSCWPGGWARWPGGRRPSRPAPACRWGTSARAPAPPRPWWRRRGTTPCGRWSAAAGAPTWPARRWPRCGRRRCWSWAATTSRCSSSTGRRRRG